MRDRVLNMAIEDLKEYKRNAVDILRKNSQYATARATAQAFDALIACNMLVAKYGGKKGGAE